MNRSKILVTQEFVVEQIRGSLGRNIGVADQFAQFRSTLRACVEKDAARRCIESNDRFADEKHLDRSPRTKSGKSGTWGQTGAVGRNHRSAILLRQRRHEGILRWRCAPRRCCSRSSASSLCWRCACDAKKDAPQCPRSARPTSTSSSRSARGIPTDGRSSSEDIRDACSRLRGRLNRKAEAEDIVQETFITFLQNLAKFRDEYSLETYLFTILRRKVIDFFRGRQTRHVLPHRRPSRRIEQRRFAVADSRRRDDRELVRQAR